ncbi:hypothetical protein Cadr_000015745 [Camelus dromedarius]|uniref:Uncharacterized protein n=1 Tax=Camelus dromedarius TaxID=9838 RepID=A0A5N4E875_CAMDR|nr:hypothetical protein Cadr_000015745 [Camelus dromedarius]
MKRKGTISLCVSLHMHMLRKGHVGTTRRWPGFKPGRGPSPETQLASTQSSVFQPPELSMSFDQFRAAAATSLPLYCVCERRAGKAGDFVGPRTAQQVLPGVQDQIHTQHSRYRRDLLPAGGFLEETTIHSPGHQQEPENGKESPAPPLSPSTMVASQRVPTVLCHTVLVPPHAPRLPTPHPHLSQKDMTPSAVLTLPWASRNSEGLSEDLHVTYYAGHFLGLNLQPLRLSFPKGLGVPSLLTQTWAKDR